MTVKIAQSCLTLCDPMDCTVHGILQARILEWVAFPFSRGSSQLRDRTQVSRPEYWSGSLSLLQGIFSTQGLNLGLLDWTQVSWIGPRSPALQGNSLPAEPQGKPIYTWVGSLSLLQRIFLTQELNWGLLCCRWILYQLSYEGSTVIVRMNSVNFFSFIFLLR